MITGRCGILNRDLTQEECFWLIKDYSKGTKLKEFEGCTYGCISDGGIACVLDGEKSFNEVPDGAITWI